MTDYYIGIMSGTSVDAIDAVLCDIAPNGQVSHLNTTSEAIPDDLKHRLQLAMSAQPMALTDYKQLEYDYSQLCISVTQTLLHASSVSANEVISIGCHGQTLWHQPPSREASSPAFSLQLINASQIAIATGIDVVCDFRQKDILTGGQGAPLVPAFHYQVFRPLIQRPSIVLNLGGIANVTWLAEHQEDVTGFDTGPANTLIDHWYQQHFGAPGFDRDGQQAASGQVINELLQALLKHPFFAQQPPKSTGREVFNAEWLSHYLRPEYPPRDVLRTLVELTAQSVANSLRWLPEPIEYILVCGGGVNNHCLMHALKQQLPQLEVVSTAAYDIDPQAVEALAFAWLAWCFDQKKPGNLPAVTGASRPVVLGSKVYAN